MSKKLEAQVWASALPSRLKPLAALLADIGSDDGTNIFPGIALMAWKLGSHESTEETPPNERTVQRHLEDLIDLGVLVFVGWHRNKSFISATDRTKPKGPGYTAEYQMFAENLPPRRPFDDRYKARAHANDQKRRQNVTFTENGSIGDNPDPVKVTAHMVTLHMVSPVSPNPYLDPLEDPLIATKDPYSVLGNVSNTNDRSDHPAALNGSALDDLPMSPYLDDDLEM